MVKVVTFLVLLEQISSGICINRACVPNTQFVMNGRICYCNSLGWWTENNCVAVGRRANCLPGQIIWQGCSQCICQETGQLICSDTSCYEDKTYQPATLPPNSIRMEAANSWCTPFKSYYINCSICVCPASGKTSEAHCATDNSCHRLPPSSSDFLQSVNKNICIPKVMYLFPCLHCLCSDGGYFILDKCVKTCQQSQDLSPTRRCLSSMFYRKNCNVCWCPENNIPDDKLCTKANCSRHSKFQSLDTLKNDHTKSRPYSFRKPKCYYCSCNTKGFINKNSCLVLECMNLANFKYDYPKNACSPGEMVPVCSECFTLRNGLINVSYCSDACSYQSKLSVLEGVLKDSTANRLLINRDHLIRTSDGKQCEPNSLYVDQGRYCLCPENGSTNFKLCTSVTDEVATGKPNKTVHIFNINPNQTCKPNTFVDVDCNTCYCGKSGKLDPKWCTYDDCDAKRIIQETITGNRLVVLPILNTTCVPGSVSKNDCNFCICSETGLLKDRVCTKNICSEIQEKVDDDKFTCEPLAYYRVDCNICLCPRDGVKNVKKCTKKICEKTFLRSDSCVPSQFFCNDCNVCVCPPNGDKADKVCTNNVCSESETPWKKIFKLSHSLIENNVAQEKDNKRQVDVCFSGEEFMVGCQMCVCPDLGLRAYATCSENGCEEQKKVNTSLSLSPSIPIIQTSNSLPELGESEKGLGHVRSRRDETCMILKLQEEEKKQCTPGSMYIIRCRECICPYVGNINLFCRPLPKGTYCEQAYPTFNFLPMARKNEEANATFTNATTFQPMNHDHTKFTCSSSGRVMDACFVCECEEPAMVVVEEHCFRSNSTACVDARPAFLDDETRAVVTSEAKSDAFDLGS